MTAQQRSILNPEELAQIQGIELNAITTTYLVIGCVMIGLITVFFFTKMPNLKEGEEKMDFAGTFRRLTKNKNYLWGITAQFFYVGAQIAVWSFIIQYVMRQLNLDQLVTSLGADARPETIMAVLRNVEPVAAAFYNLCERIGLDVLLPRTAEQAGATYYIMSLVLFFIGRFVCTALMRYFHPKNLLALLSVLAVVLCLTTIYGKGFMGIYALMGISGCMSLMFPTIYGMGIKGLGADTKIGGAGMIMAIAGAAVLTQIQGIVSDSFNIVVAYWIPAIAFLIIAYYSIVVCKKV
jgi:FHS family L-fucose permease-like MFS transporter